MIVKTGPGEVSWIRTNKNGKWGWCLSIAALRWGVAFRIDYESVFIIVLCFSTGIVKLGNMGWTNRTKTS